MPLPIERVEVVPVRTLFAHEARQLTVWLEENIDALGERIGLSLTVTSREAEVGDFRLDLECTAEDGRRVIVENQLERTDHDHLGKLLTYLVNLEAGAAVWVAPELRAEHKRVIDWLNRNTPEDIEFYLVKIEAIKVGEAIAPFFTLLAGPDAQGKRIGVKIKEWADLGHTRHEFWSQFIERSKEKTKIFANISPPRGNWLNGSIGRTGVNIVPIINKDGARVDLYIDFGKSQKERNKVAFDGLYSEREAIEKEFGTPLEWLRLDDSQTSIVRRSFSNCGLENTDLWPSIQDNLIEAARKMDEVFKQRAARL
jgi:hypothetical protein